MDQKISILRSRFFNIGVTMERGFKECQEEIARAQLPAKEQISESVYQEHTKGAEQALEACRSQLAAQDYKKLQEGERQMRRLREEVTALSQSKDF